MSWVHSAEEKNGWMRRVLETQMVLILTWFLDSTNTKLDHQCTFINSSSTSCDLIHLLHQIHVPRSLMLTISPCFDEANILELNWWDKILWETWKALAYKIPIYKYTYKKYHTSIHTPHMCTCSPYHYYHLSSYF